MVNGGVFNVRGTLVLQILAFGFSTIERQFIKAKYKIPRYAYLV